MRKKLLTLNIVLSKEIQYMLDTQNYMPGDKLPSERILAEAFHVQRPTIRDALNELIQEGIIFSEERKGYFMARPRIIKPVNMFYDKLVIEDPHIKYKLHKAESITADERFTRKILVPKDTPLYKIVRICLQDNVPVSIENYYLLKEAFPSLSEKDLSSRDVTGLAKDYAQHNIAGSNQRITLVYANDAEAKLLKIQAGTSLMKHKCMAYDDHGQLLLFFENKMLVNRFVFFRKEVR